MRAYERRLLVKVLEMASDTFSNHGCNDFNLKDHGLTKDEIKELQHAIAVNLDLEEEQEGEWTQDWMVMDHLRKVVIVNSCRHGSDDA